MSYNADLNFTLSACHIRKIMACAAIKLMLVLSLFALSPAQAENRALLIGIGDYQNVRSEANLPGINVDIDTMQLIAKNMGYKPDQIKVLQNQQATLSQVRLAFQEWIIQGSDESDHVLIYFSGHGSRIPDLNGDEQDEVDEVLMLYDSYIEQKNVVQHKGQATLMNALVDDEINQILARIKSHKILLLVDACNSGTVYKGISSSEPQHKKGVSKFFNYQGIPLMSDLTLFDHSNRPEDKELNHRFVSLSAAADDENALATQDGSIFTSGINELLSKALAQGRKLTPVQLNKELSQYIRSTIEKDDLGAVHHPQLLGDSRLVNQSLFVSHVIQGDRSQSNWSDFEQLIVMQNSDTANFTIMTPSSDYHVGEEVHFTVKVPSAGYLNIINIGPDDQAFVLYPNKYETDNFISKGSIHLPTEKMDFNIRAMEPLGKTLTLALLTSEKINLYQQLLKQTKNHQGKAPIFVPVTARELYQLMGIKHQQKQQTMKYQAEKVVINITNGS